MIRLPWDRLNDFGLNLQVVKTALAAGVSWGLASWTIGSHRPYFAPLAAILSVQATIAESVSRSLQRVGGVVAGIFLAWLFTHWFGLNAWSLSILVFVALVVATKLHLGPMGIPQVAISALLVMAIGASVRGYALERGLDTLIGALVAVVVTALVVPPDFTPQAQEALRLLALGISDVLEGIQKDLADGLEPEEASHHLQSARTINRALHEAQKAIERAEMSLRWNFLARGRQDRLKRLRQAIEVLGHSVTQVRGIARTLFVTLDRDISAPWGTLPPSLALRLAGILALMSETLKSYAYLVYSGDQEAAMRLEDLIEKANRDRHALIVDAGHLLLQGAGLRFTDIASVASDLEKMGQDLRISSHILVPVVVPDPYHVSTGGP